MDGQLHAIDAFRLGKVLTVCSFWISNSKFTVPGLAAVTLSWVRLVHCPDMGVNEITEGWRNSNTPVSCIRTQHLALTLFKRLYHSVSTALCQYIGILTEAPGPKMPGKTARPIDKRDQYAACNPIALTAHTDSTKRNAVILSVSCRNNGRTEERLP